MTVRSKEMVLYLSCVHESYHRRPTIRDHTDGSSRGAGDPGDGVQRLTDVDVEVWRSITLVHCLI